ncbi:hypothetical protein HanRHA438_Chr05g0215101 [Helianthus annuus]|uniref:Uncharacterized protein n=1 Tax=Helianthus annuus TaxID=4232 RepID=A0A251UPM7_HELAN|nr:hypothetical protein HanXRQr2_Chr05g0205391 [Helianthus annuus]KAJ0569642.1 hypothetical protein HanHA300_Chr05g0168611 [Helianthus annuus]KAJ0583956.1 hypothetical protein HanHA89_Chr05g0182701 [Helianthus annuus]KAJ0918211.1 hypothetical protein HanRHA438_Chr05g0215101 [Helianthus annuus]KAJ0921984.1 hypothetical protein HanPSC8_Chr05g0198161 [Helianthus annuus]
MLPLEKPLQQRRQSMLNLSFGRRSVDRVPSTERRWCVTQPPVRASFLAAIRCLEVVDGGA